MTARTEITEVAETNRWQILKSPRMHEIIYRSGQMVVFVQYDREGKMREATLRRMITPTLTTEVAKIMWSGKVRLWHVTRWFTEYGTKPAPKARTARKR